MKKCIEVCVCAVCTFSLFVNVQMSACSSLFRSHGPGATGECWECKPVMSDGDSLPEKQSHGERWKEGGRWLAFTLQILYQPLIITVTPQEKDFPLWIIVHFNSLINQFMLWYLGNLEWYLFSMWAVHACLSWESQKRGEEEGRTFRNWEIIYSVWKQGSEVGRKGDRLTINKGKCVIANWAKRAERGFRSQSTIRICARLSEG